MLKNITICLLLIVMTAFYACKDNIVGNLLPNQPPTTKLFLNPDTAVSKQTSVIHLHWSGDDPDGKVLGFYFNWGDSKWVFTSKNDSIFSLPIGVSDTSFSFKVVAVDNSGNGRYDTAVSQNGINYGPEPFTDLNGNNKWDNYVDVTLSDGTHYQGAESFIDIGLIDSKPATLKLPVKNTAPTIAWDQYSSHPDTSFAAMSFKWAGKDLDGDETIQNYELSLNDTTNYVSISGTISSITITTRETTDNTPMYILINGDATKIAKNLTTGDTIKLPGIKFNANNNFYVRAVDISGAKSAWLSSSTQSNSRSFWYVKKQKGKLLIVGDYLSSDALTTASYYHSLMDSVGLSGKYDLYDIRTQLLPKLLSYSDPYSAFQETIKLFDCIIWYTSNDPSLNLASACTKKYIVSGGKVFFSMVFPTDVDLSQVQGFLPISPDSSYTQTSLLGGRAISDTSGVGYPALKTTAAIARARSFKLSDTSGIIPEVRPIYYISDNADPKYSRNQLPGYIGFENKQQTIFFIGIPLNKATFIKNSVPALLKQVFKDFKVTL